MALTKRRSIFTILLAVVAVLFSGLMAMQSASATSVLSFSEGDHWSGTAICTKTKDLGKYNCHSWFGSYSGTFGKLFGSSSVGRTTCTQPNNKHVDKGEKLNYKATVTSVNTKTGTVSGTIKFTPRGKRKRDGATMQVMKGSFSKKFSVPAQLRIHKVSDDTKCTNGNTNYTLEGTKFGLWKSKSCKGSPYKTLTIGKNNYSSYVAVPKGTYYLKETTAGKGYKLDSAVVTVSTKAGSKNTITRKNTPMRDPLNLSLQKYDARSGKNVVPEDGSLKGAEFTMTYQYNSKTKPRTWVFATDAKGKIQLNENLSKSYFLRSKSNSDLYEKNGKVYYPLGTYTVKETHAPDGYRVSNKTLTIKLTQNGTVTKREYISNDGKNNTTFTGEATISEYAARGDLKFNKTLEKRQLQDFCETCDEDITSLSQEERTEKHGTTYYCPECGIEKTATHDKAEIEKHMEEKHSEEVDPDKGDKDPAEDTKADASKEDISKDTEQKETANEDKKESAEAQSSDDKKAVATEDKKSEVKTQSEDASKDEEVKNEDSSKEDSDSEGDVKDPASGDKGDEDQPAETVKYKTFPGLRTRTIDSGKDPEKNPLANVVFSLTNTKTGESHDIKTDANGNYNSKDDDSLWFGSEEKTSGVGKLEAGTYTLEEKDCEANKSLILAKPKTFTITTDGTVIDLGTIVNSNPLLQTTALDQNTGDHIAYGKKTVTIVDTVKYKNLRAGHTYKLTGTLMDKSTGKAFLDKNGNKVTAGKTFTTKTEAEGFTDEDKTGSVELPFTFEVPEEFLGKSLVAFEDMTEDGNKFAVHASLEDSDQTVTVPKVGTEAISKDTETNLVSGNGTQAIQDTVKYEGLLTGKKYTVKGYAVGKDGKKIEGTESKVDFVATEESGSVVVPINIDGSKCAGEDVVIFEELYLGDKLVADHTDLKDSKQTIHVSDIKTKAVNKDSGTNVLNKTGEQNLTDTITYKNLLPGKEYTVKGWLVNPETGEALDGTEVTKTFTPESTDGTTDMELKFTQDEDSPLSKVTVFEEVYLNDKLVGEHKDVTDSKQTLSEIEIKTKANAEDTKTNETSGVGTKKIVDTVHITGLSKDDKYEVRGWLTDDNGTKIEGSDGKTEFVATGAEMDVKVTLTLDASQYAGNDVHVFEELYTQNILIGQHKDTSDEEQVVHISKVDTAAQGKTLGGLNIPTHGKQYINDSVSYSNLRAGDTYTLKSWAVDKETGKKVKGTDTTKTFVPSTDAENPANTDDTANTPSDSKDDTATKDDTSSKDDNVSSDDKSDSEDGDVSDKDDSDNEDGDVSDGDDSEEGDDDFGDFKDDEDDVDTESLEDKSATPVTDKSNDATTTGAESKADDSTADSDSSDKTNTAESDDIRVSGTEEVSIPVDGETIKGKTYVVFQEIYDKDGALVGEHKDMNSEDQMVWGPEIGTHARPAGKISTLISGKGKTYVYDTIKYQKLERKNLYEVTSYLVDHKGHKIPGTESKTKFMPEASSGAITVKIPVDQNKLNGKTKLVAFEEIRLDGKFVTDHKDVHDKDQTVTITTPTPPSTGDMKKMLPWLILVIVIAGAGGTYYYKKRKSNK